MRERWPRHVCGRLTERRRLTALPVWIAGTAVDAWGIVAVSAVPMLYAPQPVRPSTTQSCIAELLRAPHKHQLEHHPSTLQASVKHRSGTT